MLLTLFRLPTWTPYDFIVVSCYKTPYLYIAQLLYITSIPIFGQHYTIEVLVSEFEVSPTVWNVLTPEHRDREKKHCLEQKIVSTVSHCLYQWFLTFFKSRAKFYSSKLRGAATK